MGATLGLLALLTAPAAGCGRYGLPERSVPPPTATAPPAPASQPGAPSDPGEADPDPGARDDPGEGAP